MYTWGYLKQVILSKLDLTEEEAETQNLISRFPYYANEVITQICSAIKPKRTFAEFIITSEDVGLSKIMPADFVSFGDDVNEFTYEEYNARFTRPATDEDFRYLGYNQIVFRKVGIYHISYNARWIQFGNTTANEQELDVPMDILDCIPSYVASQCFKIDDEYKSSVYRNEYEMFLARIDDTDYKDTKTFKIGGDW